MLQFITKLWGKMIKNFFIALACYLIRIILSLRYRVVVKGLDEVQKELKDDQSAGNDEPTQKKIRVNKAAGVGLRLVQ
jgi:hypothetical protein